MNCDELNQLRKDIESDRIERKESMSDKDKICQAICAFANDLPNYQKPGGRRILTRGGDKEGQLC